MYKLDDRLNGSKESNKKQVLLNMNNKYRCIINNRCNIV